MVSKSKGILTTLPKIATGTCSWRLAVRGPRPTGLGAGRARGCPGTGTAAGMAQAVPAGRGQRGRRSVRCCRPGRAGRAEGCERAPLRVPGKAMLAELPRPRGPRCHRGVCWGLRSCARPALQRSGHGAGDGHSRWGRFRGGSRALATALAGAGVPGPGCVRVPQPGTAQGGRGSAAGPARALRPRSGARTSSDGHCPRHRAPSPWGCSRPAW